ANKDSTDRISDYVLGFAALAPLADYVTVNVSSPNTPGLRGLQNREELTRLLDSLIAARGAKSKPILLRSPHAQETGGLSGRPLLAPSTEVLRGMRQRLGKSVTLVGVGGIAGGADAYAKIRAGASLVQLYTALVYQGPSLVARIKQE